MVVQIHSLATEMLQLSTSTHAWHTRRCADDGAPIPASDRPVELRPALELFCRGASEKSIDEARARRLAATAVRVGLPLRDTERAALLHDVAVMLDDIYGHRAD